MADVAQMAKEWWLLAVLGVVSLVCGVLAIAYPDVTLLAVGIIFGFYLLMAGVFELVDAMVGDPASRALSAIVGIVALLAGLICLRRPGDSLLAIVVVLGAYLIVTGVARLVRAFASVEHRGWALLDRGHRPHPGHPHPLLARREPRHAGRASSASRSSSAVSSPWSRAFQLRKLHKAAAPTWRRRSPPPPPDRGRSVEGQAVAEGLGHQVRARARAELGHRVAHVRAHGVVGDVQLARDLGAAAPVRHEPHATTRPPLARTSSASPVNRPDAIAASHSSGESSGPSATNA